EFLDPDVIARRPVGKTKGPRPDWLCGDLANALFADDLHACKVGEQWRRWCGEGEAHRLRVDGFDLRNRCHQGLERGTGRGIFDPLDAEDNVSGGELCAIVPFYPRAQLKRYGMAVRGGVPRYRKPRVGPQRVWIGEHQGLEYGRPDCVAEDIE